MPSTCSWRLVDHRLQHLALGREPEAVIDELGIFRDEAVLQMRGLAVERQRLDGAVGDGEDGAARRFIDAARLHADEAVLDEVEAADAIVMAQAIELGEQRCGRHLLAVDGDGIALQELDFDVGRLVGRILRRDGALVDVGRRLLPGVFQHLALGGGVQQVRIDREGRFAALVLGHGDLVRFGEFDQVGAALELPLAPGGDDLDVGVERIGGEFEADLVVALAGGAMGDGVGAGFRRDLDQALGDQGTGDRGAEQIDALIDGIGAEHREDEIADEFLALVLDVDFLDAQHLGLLAGGLQFAALAQVGGEGHDFGAIFGLQPFEDDRGVETARIGEDDFLHFLLRHLACGPCKSGWGHLSRPGFEPATAAIGPAEFRRAHTHLEPPYPATGRGGRFQLVRLRWRRRRQ